MAIRNLKSAVMSVFQGKNTSQNLTDAIPGTLLSAKNVMVLADNQIRKAPGYKVITQIGSTPVIAFGDFERNVDGKHFIFVQANNAIVAMRSDGTAQQTFPAGSSPTKPFQFVQSSFICYASNGVDAYRFVDNGGTLTQYKWGMDGATTAPSVSLSPGTLTLNFGRTYVYCPVSKYTDSLGIERVSVGPPSPISAHTGPISAQIVNLTNIEVFSDPQVNFIWIFETTDSPQDTSSTFYFAAEIVNGVTSYGDALVDDDLDQTRLAPFDNNPAPPASILEYFQNRIAALEGTQMRLSGYSEIALGIPEESWPLNLFFNIPAGSREGTALITPDQGTTLIVDTADAKFRYTGYDATTFTEQDRVASPGAVGPLAQCHTPFGTAFLSQSKRLWLWNALSNNPPTEISGDVAQSFTGTYGMEDLSADDLAKANVLWYSYGRTHFILVLARTSDAPDAYSNLLQIWSIPVRGSASSGQISGSSNFFNQIGGIFQTDKIPSVSFTTGKVIKDGNIPYVFLGGTDGFIYRFPDGYTDNQIPFLPNFSSPWSLLGSEAKKRFYWLDLYFLSPQSLLSDGGPAQNFELYAAVSESAEDDPKWIQVDLSMIPAPEGQSQFAIRGDLQIEGLNVGRYIRFSLVYPEDDADEVLLKAIIWFQPLYKGAP